MNFTQPLGAAPIDPDEIHDLIPSISTREELNEWEQDNIKDAYTWALKSKKLPSGLLTSEGLKLLHKEMFKRVWKWAGKFRRSDKNIGVNWRQVPTELKNLCDDIAYQIEDGSDSLDLIAVRFHHRLVAIHAFPNGNGRHGRLATDLLLQFNGGKAFSWGTGQITDPGKVRDGYIAALRSADKGNYEKLKRFVRS